MSIEKKEVFNCDYSDLEQVIFNHYGKEYEILVMEEIGSSQYAAQASYNISVGKLDKFDQMEIDKFKAGENVKYMLSTLLQDLCNHDKLEAGEYVIDISW